MPFPKRLFHRSICRHGRRLREGDCDSARQSTGWRWRRKHLHQRLPIRLSFMPCHVAGRRAPGCYHLPKSDFIERPFLLFATIEVNIHRGDPKMHPKTLPGSSLENPDVVAFRGVFFGFSLVKAEFGHLKLSRQTPLHNLLARDELREKHTTKGYHVEKIQRCESTGFFFALIFPLANTWRCGSHRPYCGGIGRSHPYGRSRRVPPAGHHRF